MSGIRELPENDLESHFGSTRRKIKSKRDHKQGILIKKIVIVTCYLRLAVFFSAFVGSDDSRQYHLSLSYL